jgi:hypothetical protein
MSMATSNQKYWLRRCLDERVVPTDAAERLHARLAHDDVTYDDASNALSWLFAQPRKTDATNPDPVTEAGVYRGDGGCYYRVQIGQDSGQPYAMKLVIDDTTHRHRWDYDTGRGALAHLHPADRLTLKQAREFGLTTGFCGECGLALEDPVSQRIGLGTTCGPRKMGKSAYRAEAKVVKTIPEVAAAIMARQERRAAVHTAVG